jgi:hypothetical protein
MNLRVLPILILLSALPTFAHGMRFGDGQPVSSAETSGGVLCSVPSGTINFCNYPANAVPCTNKATTYTDITLDAACPSITPGSSVTWNVSAR